MKRLTTLSLTATPGILPLALEQMLAANWEKHHTVARFLTHEMFKGLLRTQEGQDVVFNNRDSGKAKFKTTHGAKTVFATTYDGEERQ